MSFICGVNGASACSIPNGDGPKDCPVVGVANTLDGVVVRSHGAGDLQGMGTEDVTWGASYTTYKHGQGMFHRSGLNSYQYQY